MNKLYEKTNAASYYITQGSVNSPKGFRAGGFHCGIKRKRPDLAWLYSEVPANAAAVYTTNQFQAAPITVTKESISIDKQLQGMIINSGNANAYTGEKGLEQAYLMRKWYAEKVGTKEHLVGVSSTGVIGEPLPIEKIRNGIANISVEQEDIINFEKAILTTDTFTKHVCVKVEINGTEITIAGAAKGSGMIHPNMATMLSFITTDADIEQESLQYALSNIINDTFNMITVDGDTSTNDMVVAMANGMAENEQLSVNNPYWDQFYEAFTYVCQSLAKYIAKDGEGATKLVEVKVTGAKTKEDAKTLSKTVIGSNLVKTAIFGADANWGRIINAIGYSGVKVDSMSISIALGSITVVHNGVPVDFSEEEATQYMKESDPVQIFVALQDGNDEAIAWGCDLTYDYVKINASYRT